MTGDLKKTITSIFMVPTLKIGRSSLMENGFINAYVSDAKKLPAYQNAVYLLFQPKDLDKFRHFLEEEYERTKDIIDEYDYEGGYVVVVYKLDVKFKRDFLLVMEGLYSKTSKEFQSMFPKIVKVQKEGLRRDEISLQYRIFNKTEDLVKFWEDKLNVEFDEDQEIWHGFVLENETLDIDKINQPCTTTK
jgi:hypothetical protein